MWCRPSLLIGLKFLVFLLPGLAFPLPGNAAGKVARGIVFHDKNGDQHFNAGDVPLGNIGVSNGQKIVSTGADGRFTLSIDADDDIVFVPSSFTFKNQTGHRSPSILGLIRLVHFQN